MASMTTNATNPKQRPLGIIFALPIEAHTFERRLGNATKYQGQRSVIYEGHVSDHPVVWTISGVGREAARNAAQLIIDGHQPHTLVSLPDSLVPSPHTLNMVPFLFQKEFSMPTSNVSIH